MRDPLGRRDRKVYRENTVVTRTVIVSKFKRNILEGPLSSDFAEEGFL